MIDPIESTDAELWDATTSEEREERAEAMHTLAIRLSGTPRDDQAEGLFLAALSEYQAAESVLDIARISYSYSYANHLNYSRRYEEALALLATSIAGYEAELRAEWLADAIRERARSFQGLGKVEEAEKEFARAVADYIALELHESAARAQAERVELFRSFDRQAEGARESELAISLAVASGEPELSVLAHHQFTRCLLALGECDSALASAQTALALASHLRVPGQRARAREMVSKVMINRRKFAEAIPLLDDASAEFREAGKITHATWCDVERLRCLYGLTRPEEAEVLAGELSAFTASIDAPYLRVNLALVIGDARTTAGQTVAAAEKYWFAQQEAERLGEITLVRRVIVTWAEAAVAGGDYGKALELVAPLDVTLWGQNRVMRARHLAVRATAQAHREPDPARAELYILECLTLGSAVGLAYPHALCYEQWAEIRRLQGRHAEASALIAHAVGLYLRAGRSDRVDLLSSWLLPEGYLTRVPTDSSLLDPALIDAVESLSATGVVTRVDEEQR